MTNIIFAYFVVIMYVAAMNSKALGVSIVAAVAMMAGVPDTTICTFLFLLYVPAFVLASFRD